jgi:crotonobetainyl-CoA:carnitine CoA-transferase CaiB-like acyl-CoA transferase
VSVAGPLDGIQVLDLTVARAGPTCVRQLADLGASVIRVSRRESLDLGGSDACNLHRNKRSILLDLKHPRGHEVLLALVRRADVFVENFRPPVKHRLGIDYERLRAENPRLIYASLSGFGQDGPYAERAGVDPIVQGMAGLMSVTGPPGGGPWRAGIAVSDTAAGTFLAQGVMAALYQRERTGSGQWVHTSLLEALLNFMDFQAARWLIDGEVPGQAGNDHPTLFPMGTFHARDGHLNVAPALHWERFARAVGAPEWIEDPRFATPVLRARNREPLREAIDAVLGTRDMRDWIEILNAAGIPCGPVLAMDEVFEDPQVRHLDVTETVEHAREGPQRVLRLPLHFSEARTSIRNAAPVPGAQTREILAEIGYDEQAIEALLASGAAALASSDGAPPATAPA